MPEPETLTPRDSKVVSLFQAGATMTDIGRQMSLHRHTVRSILRRVNLTERPRFPPPPPRVRAILDDVAELYGVDPAELADPANRSPMLSRARSYAVKRIGAQKDGEGKPLYTAGMVGFWTGMTRQWAHLLSRRGRRRKGKPASP